MKRPNVLPASTTARPAPTTPGNLSNPRVVEAIKHAVDLDSRGQTGLAVQHLSALIVEFPQVASLHSYLTWFLLEGGQFDEAIEHSRQAVLLSPKSEKASIVFVQSLWKAGHRMETFDEMKLFVAIGPSREYSDMIKGMEQIMADEDGTTGQPEASDKWKLLWDPRARATDRASDSRFGALVVGESARLPGGSLPLYHR